MNSNRNSNLTTLETQIAIIGAGGAGLAAAVAAKEKGAKDVIVLEKAVKPGGSTSMAFGLFGAESPTQRRALIDARRDYVFRIQMDYCKWSINPRIFRAFVDKSGDTIRWLEEKGITFELSCHRPNQVPMFLHASKGRGKEIINVLAKNFESLGGRLFCKTEAKEILTRDQEGVTGLLATRKGGEELRITASSVIIATGGYGANKELLRKYCPRYNDNILYAGFYGCTGDGLSMALKIGAATEGLGILHMTFGYVPGEAMNLGAVGHEPYVVWVNKRGERFIDEAYGYEHSRQETGGVLARQPESTYYPIFDETHVQRMKEEGFTFGGHGAKVWPGTKRPELPELLQSAAKRGNIKISNSWDDIASWIGVAPEVLKATIDEYNSFCDKGDDYFAKDRRYLVALRNPPYYAFKCHPRFYGTFGGIKINHHMEVLDHDDKPIPGVYAAGIDVGGWCPEVYNAYLSGHALGFPINSGRIAGENAIAYLLRK